MAVKKSAAPKASAPKVAAPKKPKATVKKAAPKKEAPKAAPTAVKKAAPKAAAPTAVKKAAPKKAAPKKAAIKLTDGQLALLAEVAKTGEAGLLSTKANTRSLTALQGKKLVKKGKKSGDQFLYLITKLGSKHATTTPAAGSTEPAAGA